MLLWTGKLNEWELFEENILQKQCWALSSKKKNYSGKTGIIGNSCRRRLVRLLISYFSLNYSWKRFSKLFLEVFQHRDATVSFLNLSAPSFSSNWKGIFFPPPQSSLLESKVVNSSPIIPSDIKGSLLFFFLK